MRVRENGYERARDRGGRAMRATARAWRSLERGKEGGRARGGGGCPVRVRSLWRSVLSLWRRSRGLVRAGSAGCGASGGVGVARKREALAGVPCSRIRALGSPYCSIRWSGAVFGAAVLRLWRGVFVESLKER